VGRVPQFDLAVLDDGVHRLVGSPSNSRPSKPAHLSRAPDQPPWWLLSVTVPVSGDFVQTAIRPLIVTCVPDSGPFMNASRFSGSIGSTSGPWSKTYFTPSPRAPIYFSASSSSIDSYATSPSERSMRATLS